jgi:hypothetical protein
MSDRPPIFGTWRRMYTAIVIYLVAIIALFAWFTRSWNQ